MSLNKTLDRFFDEIRREARRNPAFADRLDAVLRGHSSRRDVDVSALEDMLSKPVEDGVEAVEHHTEVETIVADTPTPELNPVGLYQREGEEALAAELDAHGLATLLDLVREHNLDPSGEAESLDRDALAAHIVAQSKRRAERDKKLFDY